MKKNYKRQLTSGFVAVLALVAQPSFAKDKSSVDASINPTVVEPSSTADFASYTTVTYVSNRCIYGRAAAEPESAAIAAAIIPSIVSAGLDLFSSWLKARAAERTSTDTVSRGIASWSAQEPKEAPQCVLVIRGKVGSQVNGDAANLAATVQNLPDSDWLKAEVAAEPQAVPGPLNKVVNRLGLQGGVDFLFEGRISPAGVPGYIQITPTALFNRASLLPGRGPRTITLALEVSNAAQQKSSGILKFEDVQVNKLLRFEPLDVDYTANVRSLVTTGMMQFTPSKEGDQIMQVQTSYKEFARKDEAFAFVAKVFDSAKPAIQAELVTSLTPGARAAADAATAVAASTATLQYVSAFNDACSKIKAFGDAPSNDPNASTLVATAASAQAVANQKAIASLGREPFANILKVQGQGPDFKASNLNQLAEAVARCAAGPS